MNTKSLQLQSYFKRHLKTMLSVSVVFLFNITAHAQLSGTYTIDASSAASATNYTTFSSAVEDMLLGTRTDGGTPNGTGINGAVIFNAANGTYAEQVEITAITGSSAANTVTFQSVNGDSSLVTVQFNPSSNNSNYMFRLNGASYINFFKIGTDNTNSFRCTNYEIMGNANNISISNCALEGNNVSFGSAQYSLIRSEDDVDNSISITNNMLLEGGNGIYLEGALGLSFETNLIISSNTFDGQASEGIYLTHQDGFSINNNSFINGANAVGAEIMWIDSASGTNNISYNNIVGEQKKGIHLLNVIGAGNPTSIYNNSVAHTSTALGQKGISLENVSDANLKHNSTWVYSAGVQDAYGLDVRGGSTNISVTGNVFYVEIGYAIYDQSGNSIISNDYNLLFARTGTKLAFSGGNMATLTAWQTATGDGANSIQANPIFVSPSDLHLVSGSPCINAGVATAGITLDLDGESRNATPDLGADEQSCSGAAPTPAYTFNVNGLDVTYTNGSTGAGGWFWDFGDGTSSTMQNPAVHSYPSIALDSAYRVCLYVTNTCGIDSSCQSVLVCAPPVAAFTSSTGDPTVVFTDGSTNAVSWAWDFGDGNNSTMQNPSNTYGANGPYTICLVVTNGCGDTNSTCTNVNIFNAGVGIGEFSNDINVSIYPNPVNDILLIGIESNEVSIEKITITDLTGRVVLNDNSKSLKLNVSDITAGTYFVIVHLNDNQKVIQKIIIH